MWISVNDEIQLRHGTGYRRKKVKLLTRLIELEVETELPDAAVSSKARTSVAPRTVPYAFRVSLGGWAGPYQGASSYVRPVLQRIVQYDATRPPQMYVVRIALCLMFYPSERGQTWRVGDLLERAHIDLPTHHIERFREFVEAALDILERDRIIGGWVYSNDTDLSVRNWLGAWLDWDVVFSERPLRLVSHSPAAVPRTSKTPTN
jgi:hypothetical protein